MKVPFLNKKIRNDFKNYIDEYSYVVGQSLLNTQADPNSFILYKITYPLFVLLESMSGTEFFIDPSRRILLEESVAANNKPLALKQIKANITSSEEGTVLKNGVLKRIFTPFFQELYSDLLLLLNNYYSHNYRGSYISMRCILEDLYRHLYYKDHVEEFAAIKSGIDEYALGIRPVVLREYLPKTSFLGILKNRNRLFQEVADGNDYFSWNNDLYRRTSFFVHASSPKAMSSFTTNLDLVDDPEEQARVQALAQEITELAIAFIVLAHVDYFSRFNDYAKALVLNAYPDVAKHNLRSLVNI